MVKTRKIIPQNPRGTSSNEKPGNDDIGWIDSLKKKMLIGVLGLLVVSTFTSVILITNLAGKRLAEDIARDAQELGGTIKSNLRILMLKRDPRMIQTVLDDVGKNKSSIVKAFILDKTGRIAYSTEKKEIGTVLNRFAEGSCRICHHDIQKAPENTTITFEVNGVKIQRNINVINNEPVCHECHASSDRIRGKLIIDRSLSRADALIASLRLIVFSSGALCLILIVPFVFRQVNKYITELQKALAEIKTLHGILPICSSCKRIRDDSGSWKQMEAYISSHTDADFSHGYCPECAEKAAIDFEEYIRKSKQEKH